MFVSGDLGEKKFEHITEEVRAFKHKVRKGNTLRWEGFREKRRHFM